MFGHLAIGYTIGALLLFAPQETDTTKPPVIEKIDTSVIKSIEDKSLPFNSHAPRLIMSIPAEVDEMELTNPYVDSSGINSTSMEGRLRGKPGVSAESFVKDVNAMRILAFMTQPGERITFNLKSEQSKVRLAVYPDPKSPKLKSAIKRANMPPNASRSRKLIFTNSTKEPYEMLLLVYGLHGYQYELSWENKVKK